MVTYKDLGGGKALHHLFGMKDTLDNEDEVMDEEEAQKKPRGNGRRQIGQRFIVWRGG